MAPRRRTRARRRSSCRCSNSATMRAQAASSVRGPDAGQGAATKGLLRLRVRARRADDVRHARPPRILRGGEQRWPAAAPRRRCCRRGDKAAVCRRTPRRRAGTRPQGWPSSRRSRRAQRRPSCSKRKRLSSRAAAHTAGLALLAPVEGGGIIVCVVAEC